MKKIVCLCFFMLYSSSAYALIIKSLPVEDLIEKSNQVFIAQVLNIKENNKSKDGIKYSSIELKIIKAYKNSVDNLHIEFKQVSLQDSKAWKYLNFLPIPKYKVGQYVLFFMSKKSSQDFQMPIGFDQGRLNVQLNQSNLDSSVIELGHEHVNLLNGMHSSLPVHTLNGLNQVKNKQKPFTVKDFSDLFQETQP